jgi:restriction system protein
LAAYEEDAKKRRREREDAKKRRREAPATKGEKLHFFKKYVRRHAKTLYLKRRALLARDDYGRRNVRAWFGEVERFLTDVVPAKTRAKSVIDGAQAKRIVLKIVARYGESHRAEPEVPENPFDFETFCAQVLSRAGWKTSTTKRSGDQGVDVLAEKDGKCVILQCKLYSHPVGNKAVQEAFAGARYVGAAAAVVVSNAGFTTSAKQLARSLGVHLVHYSELADLEAKLRKAI